MRSSLLIGLLLAAASAPAVLAAAMTVGPIVKDGVEITLLPTVGPAGGPGSVIQVDFDLEVKTDDAIHRLGFRSLRGTTAVDCHRGANRFLRADAFDQAGLRGPSRPRTVTGAWVQPNPDSYMFALTQRICASAPAEAAPAPPAMSAPGPLPVVTAQALPPPAPMPTANSPAAPTDRVAVASPKPAPPPVRIASAASSTARPAPAAPRAPSWAGKPAGKGVAQVAAAGTAKDAQRVLNALHGLITPPLSQTVEQATVQNASIYRASVVGFASLTDAKAFCARAASISKTCWVHWKAEAPAKPGRA